MRLFRQKTIVWLITALLAILALDPALAATQDAIFRQAQESRQRFEKDQKAMGLRHKWLAVIKQYEKVLTDYPTGWAAPKAGLAIGDLYLGLYRRSRRTSDAERAVGAYRNLTKDFPRSGEASQAQLKIGQIYHRLNDPDRAYVELLKVELNHPQSKNEVAEARKLMAEISGDAGYELPESQTGTTAKAAKSTSDSTGIEASVNDNCALVNSMRHWHNPNYTRVAVDLTKTVKFRDHLLRPDPKLNKPMRLYLDLSPARIGSQTDEEIPIGDGLLKKARVAQYDQDTVRLVLDIQNIRNYRIFSLENPFRIVVDVMGEPESDEDKAEITAKIQTKLLEKKSSPEKSSKPETPSKVDKPQAPLTDLRDTALKRKKLPRGRAKGDYKEASLARQLGLGIHKIVIDPGHGGKDNGATGITGLHEKDLTLKIARKLAAKIRQRLDLEVVLTRDEDKFLPLEERTALANTQAADLFLSIHANAHNSHSIHGIETYFLNIATDKEAIRVAAVENATTQKNMSDLQMILSDLMLNSKISESGRLAIKTHKAMVSGIKKKYKGIRDLGVKQAPFYVLIGANMPSILVEVGFISNKVEETRLKSNRYIDQLTDGLVDGIKQYQASIRKGL